MCAPISIMFSFLLFFLFYFFVSIHNKCSYYIFIFVQTGFVETLKPQFTPGQVVSPPNPSSLTPTPRISQTPEPNPEIESLKEQLKDLSEKLETMRSKYLFFY